MRLPRLSSVVLLVALAACSEDDSRPAPPPSGEPNDTLAQATPIGVGGPVGAVISSPFDEDYYRFAVPAGGAVVHIQTFDGSGVTCNGVDTYLELYSAGGVSLGWDDNGGVPFYCSDIASWLPEGIHHVAVAHAGYAPDAFQYVLLITFSSAGAGSAESEPNGSIGTANGPFSDDAVVSGAISPAGEEDFFAIANPSAMARTVSLQTYGGTIGTCGIDTVLDLYSAAGTWVTGDDDNGYGTCSQLSYTIPPYTTYYAAVRAFSSYTTFSYLLHVDFL